MSYLDAILGKISNVRNCLSSIKKITNLDPEKLNDQVAQDVFVLNLERATQACIDMANLCITQEGYELPRSYRHGFLVLNRNNIIDSELCEKMEKMAGFRNIAVHDYAALDLNILKSILTKNLCDIEDYCEAIFKYHTKAASQKTVLKK